MATGCTKMAHDWGGKKKVFKFKLTKQVKPKPIGRWRKRFGWLSDLATWGNGNGCDGFGWICREDLKLLKVH